MPRISISENYPARQTDFWIHLRDCDISLWIFEKAEDLHLLLECLRFDINVVLLVT